MADTWQTAFRVGIAPQLTTPGLLALRQALVLDDSTLLQGETSLPNCPPPQDWPCEAACPIGYCGWVGEHLETVDQVEDYFAEVTFAADRALGGSLGQAGSRWVVNFWDETPRAEAVPALLAEVELALSRRLSTAPSGRAV